MLRAAVNAVRRGLRRYARPRPPIGFTLSRFAGEGSDRRSFPVLTFTNAHRHIGWRDFEDALARAEQAFRDRPDRSVASYAGRGVTIDAHPAYGPSPAGERELERAAIVEGFKSAMRR
jgi:hypothetical protein